MCLELLKTLLRKTRLKTKPKSKKDLSSVDRVIRTATVKASQLLANPENFRIHGEMQAGVVSAIITDVGWVRHVLVNETTGHVIDGHLRIVNAMKKGGEDAKVPVDYISVSVDEETLLLSMLDESGKMAFVDTTKRDELIARLKDGGHSETIKIILESLADRRATLIVEAERAIAERGKKGLMAGVSEAPENPLSWVQVDIVVRRTDKEELFRILDKAKGILKEGLQADALMKILRGWDAKNK